MEIWYKTVLISASRCRVKYYNIAGYFQGVKYLQMMTNRGEDCGELTQYLLLLALPSYILDFNREKCEY